MGRRVADNVDADVSEGQALDSSWRGGEVAGSGVGMCGASHRCRRLSATQRAAVGPHAL